jgi:KH domain
MVTLVSKFASLPLALSEYFISIWLSFYFLWHLSKRRFFFSLYRVIIRATHTQNVLGEKGRRIRELTSLVQKRFKFPENTVELYAERVQNRGLCAIAQCESVKFKLLNGLAVRRLVQFYIVCACEALIE